jgi:hypothetical protein
LIQKLTHKLRFFGAESLFADIVICTSFENVYLAGNSTDLNGCIPGKVNRVQLSDYHVPFIWFSQNTNLYFTHRWIASRQMRHPQNRCLKFPNAINIECFSNNPQPRPSGAGEDV